MKRKEWNSFLDKYLGENIMSSDDYDELNEVQTTIIQEIKKSLKRIENKNEIL